MAIVYVNGEFVEEENAKISVFDRGFLFADGVYEAISVLRGQLIDAEPHYDRLGRSLDELGMAWPLERHGLHQMILTLIEHNELTEGMIYFQVTRGAAKRQFHFPDPASPSSLVAFTIPMKLIDRPEEVTGVKVVSTEDLRWKRRDIKSIALLPQCMGKQFAYENGCYEALMVEDGMVTEGTSSSAYIIKDNVIITRPLSKKILPGVTRKAILKLAEEEDVAIEERLFTLEEAYQADEACLTAASNFIMPIVEIDGKTIGSGKPGPIVKRLREIYVELALDGSLTK
ncbi:MAG: D-alanine transaminase [Saprospiraceae bacterium]|jgi:D-alanine transaminase